jgi:hypothetical protein
MRRFLRDNALSVTIFGCFLVLWAAQSITGFHAANADNRQHHQPLETYPKSPTARDDCSPTLASSTSRSIRRAYLPYFSKMVSEFRTAFLTLVSFENSTVPPSAG